MQATDLAYLSIAEAATRLRRREFSPVELTDACLCQIEALNPRLNAYITVTAERARADARRAEEAIAAGRDQRPLLGIPIALKDLYATEGIRTTAGAKILSDWTPERDSSVARRLREQGSVLLGKLNTHELAYGVTTNNPHFGPTRNPWSLEMIPGGSSGGSGAAASAGMALGTMGTDTGGSIRIPASLCGVVGLKASYGRVSKAGVVPLSFVADHAGPLTRTVEDAALMLQAVAGYDPEDASSVRAPVPDYLAALDGDLRGLRAGVPRQHFYERLDAEVRAAIEAAIEVLAGLGVEMGEVEIPGIGESLPGLFGLILTEAQEYHAQALRERPQDFGPDVGAILAQQGPSGLELAGALRQKYALTAAMRQTLETVDVLLTPTTPVPATRIGQETVRYGGIEEPVLLAMIRCTYPFNATGLPALSLPCGFTSAELPIGLQIAGRPFDEATVLRVAHAYEQATTWHLRRPPAP